MYIEPELSPLFKATHNQDLIARLSNAVELIDLDEGKFINKLVFERMLTAGAVGTETYSDRYIVNNTTLKIQMKDIIPVMPSDQELKNIFLGNNPNYEEQDILVHSHKSSGIFRKFIIVNGALRLMGSVGVDESVVVGIAIGDESLVKAWMGKIKDNFTTEKLVRYTQLLGFGQDGPLLHTVNLNKEESFHGMGHDAFYPFIEGGIDKLVADYSQSNSPVLLLIGDRGLGKTSLIRALNAKLDAEYRVLCDDEMVIKSPGFMPFIKTHDNSIISIEDADNLLGKREDGNQQMSSLLNYVGGVLSTKTKMILSTNLPSLNKVDSALYRPGRTFRVIEFRKLTADEANTAREAIGKDPIDFAELDVNSISLAEALNWEEITDDRGAKTGYGFIRGK